MATTKSNLFYLSGPMTGYDDYNFPKFHEVANRLRKSGYSVFNPAESFEGRTDLDWTTYMEHDYEAILDSSAVMVMEDWESSIGCIMELLVAVSTGKNVFLYKNNGSYARLFKNTDNARQIVTDIMNMYVAGSEPKTGTTQNNDTETILEEAQRLVHGDRGSAYGHPYDDFSRTAKIWSAILGTDITPADVSLCMVGLKISREVNKPKRDNRVDGAGYFETLDMVREESDRRSRLSSKAESKIESEIRLNKKRLKESRRAKEEDRLHRMKAGFAELAKMDLSSSAWDDYDDKGIPYWDYIDINEDTEGIID
jgi:Domain of unknown function (DUF6378)/Domain of unknown function (DUF4406)